MYRIWLTNRDFSTYVRANIGITYYDPNHPILVTDNYEKYKKLRTISSIICQPFFANRLSGHIFENEYYR